MGVGLVQEKVYASWNRKAADFATLQPIKRCILLCKLLLQLFDLFLESKNDAF